MTELKIVVIHGNASMDHFMHAAGVFESFKVLAMPETFVLDFDETCGKDPNYEDLTKATKEGLESLGRRVVAVFFPGRSEGAWVDPTVKAISNGHQWTTLQKALDAYFFVRQDNQAV